MTTKIDSLQQLKIMEKAQFTTVLESDFTCLHLFSELLVKLTMTNNWGVHIQIHCTIRQALGPHNENCSRTGQFHDEHQKTCGIIACHHIPSGSLT